MNYPLYDPHNIQPAQVPGLSGAHYLAWGAFEKDIIYWHAAGLKGSLSALWAQTVMTRDFAFATINGTIHYGHGWGIKVKQESADKEDEADTEGEKDFKASYFGRVAQFRNYRRVEQVMCHIQATNLSVPGVDAYYIGPTDHFAADRFFSMWNNACELPAYAEWAGYLFRKGIAKDLVIAGLGYNMDVFKIVADVEGWKEIIENAAEDMGIPGSMK
jgi:hypothetical protein